MEDSIFLRIAEDKELPSDYADMIRFTLGENNYTPILWAAKIQKSKYLREYFLKEEFRTLIINDIDKDGNNILHLISENDDVESYDALFDFCTKNELQSLHCKENNDGQLPIHVAFREDSLNLCKIFGKSDQLLLQPDKNGFSPIVYAFINENKYMFKEIPNLENDKCYSRLNEMEEIDNINEIQSEYSTQIIPQNIEIFNSKGDSLDIQKPGDLNDYFDMQLDEYFEKDNAVEMFRNCKKVNIKEDILRYIVERGLLEKRPNIVRFFAYDAEKRKVKINPVFARHSNYECMAALLMNEIEFEAPNELVKIKNEIDQKFKDMRWGLILDKEKKELLNNERLAPFRSYIYIRLAMYPNIRNFLKGEALRVDLYTRCDCLDQSQNSALSNAELSNKELYQFIQKYIDVSLLDNKEKK